MPETGAADDVLETTGDRRGELRYYSLHLQMNGKNVSVSTQTDAIRILGVLRDSQDSFADNRNGSRGFKL